MADTIGIAQKLISACLNDNNPLTYTIVADKYRVWCKKKGLKCSLNHAGRYLSAVRSEMWKKYKDMSTFKEFIVDLNDELG